MWRPPKSKRQNGGIAGQVVLRLPDDSAGGLVESHDAGSFSARIDHEAVAVNQRRLAETPLRHGRAELLDVVESPHALAGFRVEANERSIAGKRIQPVAVHLRHAARAAALVILISLAGRRLPDLLPAGGVQSQDELLVTLLTLGVDSIPHHSHGRVAFAEAFHLPDRLGSALPAMTPADPFQLISHRGWALTMWPNRPQAQGCTRRREQKKLC